MGEFDGEFREFASSFAKPLTRVAYLLFEGTPDEALAGERAVRALARTRRNWRVAVSEGSPEALAIESLLSRLPRSGREGLVSAQAAATAADGADPDDVGPVIDACWRAWTSLPPRERVPLLFADLGVVSTRLQGLAVPEAFASHSRLFRFESVAWAKLRASVAADPSCAPYLNARPRDHLDNNIVALVGQALSGATAAVNAPLDVGSRALAVAARTRRRIAVSFAATAVVAAVVATLGASISRNASTASAGTSVSPTPSASSSGFVANDDEQVVDWPIRGTLRDDTSLLSSLRTTFVASHPDAIGGVQILLATETPSFRLAYLTAHSRQGVIGSWFFGPIEATGLTEGSFNYNGEVSSGGVIAASLSDPQGHAVLVVIGPSDTTSVQFSDTGAGDVADASFAAIDQTDGVVVRDVSRLYLPSLWVRLFAGAQLRWDGPVPVVQLGAREPDLPDVTVERGKPDPAALARALQVQANWTRTGELSSGGKPVVLWGGTDDAGKQLVVLRVKTLHLADLLVVAWPDGDAEYLLHPDAPDYTFAFVYPTTSGVRVGVLTMPGVASVDLMDNGVPSARQPVGAMGFASLEVDTPYPTLVQRSFVVRLFDANGREVAATPLLPPV